MTRGKEPEDRRKKSIVRREDGRLFDLLRRVVHARMISADEGGKLASSLWTISLALSSRRVVFLPHLAVST